MAKTRDEFVKKWRYAMTGLAMYGYVSEQRDGPMKRAERLFNMPEEIERLLNLMYDDMDAKLATVNGKTEASKEKSR